MYQRNLLHLLVLGIVLMGSMGSMGRAADRVGPARAQTTDAALALRLERTACLGSCPVYTLSIYEDGTVVYEGQAEVDVVGEETIEIDPARVVLMVQTFVDAGFFEWDTVYDEQPVTDHPSVITTVVHEGVTHRIERYTGDPSAPLALIFLEQWVDEMIYTPAWTGNELAFTTVPNDGEPPVVTLRRTACLGECPVFSLVAYADGTVVYTGVAFVDDVGVFVYTVDPVVVELLVGEARAYGFFEWQDRYDAYIIFDLPTVYLSVRDGDQSQSIERYVGDPNAPVGLVYLEDSFDDLIGYLPR